MVAKSNAAPDAGEDIIELTDIIERGNPPASSEASAAASAPTGVQIDDLQQGDSAQPHEGEDDLDALLAEIGSYQAQTPAGASPRTDAPAVNPDETLDMPDMTEVENLLDGLSIPAQPKSSAQTTPPAEQLDDVLDQLMAGSGPASDPQSADSELDALLDAAPAAPLPQEPRSETDAPPAKGRDVLDELEALLDAASPTPENPDIPDAAKTPPEEASGDEDAPVDAAPPDAPGEPDELDALLDAAPAAAESGDVLDELDALLDAAPPAPESPDTPEASPEAASAAEDDLDALLDAISVTAPEDSGNDAPQADIPQETAAVPTPADAAVPPLPGQWDSLLGGETPDAEQTGPAPAESARFEAALDELRVSLSAVAAAQAEGAKSARADLDTLTGRVDALTEEAEKNAAAETERARLRADLEELRTRAAAPANAASQPGPGDDVPELQTLARNLQERLERLETRAAEHETFKTKLEDRLRKLEDASREDLERMAAAAAARILREELSALLQEGACSN